MTDGHSITEPLRREIDYKVRQTDPTLRLSPQYGEALLAHIAAREAEVDKWKSNYNALRIETGNCEANRLRDVVNSHVIALQEALKEVERLKALRVEMFNAVVEYGAGDDLLYHALKAIMDAWFAGGA